MTPALLDPSEPPLIDLVDFKWLMVGEGHRIDTDRLAHDPAYARACLALAAHSTQPTLQRAARRLRSALHLP